MGGRGGEGKNREKEPEMKRGGEEREPGRHQQRPRKSGRKKVEMKEQKEGGEGKERKG